MRTDGVRSAVNAVSAPARRAGDARSVARAVRPAHAVTDPTTAAPLRELLRATPRLAPERAALLLGGVARALAARGAPYGALAPERVLVGPGDAVTLAPAPRPDAGPAPWPTYLAPEQIDGRPADERSDVYALGLVGWEMLAGRPPWEGDSLYGIVVKQREQDLPRLSTLRPGLPRPLVQAVEGALHKAPGDRWQSAAEVLAVLGPLGGRAAPPTPDLSVAAGVTGRVLPPRVGVPGPPVPLDDEDDIGAPAVPGPRPAARPVDRSSAPRRRWLTVTALTLAALAAAAGAYAVVRGREDTTATRAWLDSVTAAGGGTAAAAPVVTTQENTTSAPIRRTGGARRPTVDDSEQPDAEDPAVAVDSGVIAPAPFPPPTPTFPRRPGRPTVPVDTSVRPDTLTPPDSTR
jgi:hypothetical protein